MSTAKTEFVSVRISEKEKRKLDEIAEQMGVTRSDVLRMMIRTIDIRLVTSERGERK